MEIIAFVLGVYGAIGTTSAFLGTISGIIEKFKKSSAKDLFFKSFVRATKRNSSLIHQQVESDTGKLSIDKTQLRDAIDQLICQYRSLKDSKKVINKVINDFTKCIKINGTVVKLKDQLAKQILRDASSGFFAELPFTEAAFKSFVIGELRKIHKVQTENFGEVENKLDELMVTQQRILSKISYIKPAVLLNESSRAEFKNPFRITKAEEFDHNYPLLATLFRQPANYDLIKGRDNLLLAGGRGCGKSMILRSLAVQTSLQLEATQRGLDKITYKNANLDYYGVYIKLAMGYFDDYGTDAAVHENTATQFFQHIFNMQLLKATINSLMENRQLNNIEITDITENTIVSKIGELLDIFDGTLTRFDELKKIIAKQEAKVRTYLGFLRINLPKKYDGTFTHVSDFPENFCRIILDSVNDLKDSRIYFLLDEFENLAEFQQTTINTMTKLRPDSLTLKLATRSLGVKSRIDLQGEPIQSPRDYRVVPLDYNPRSADYRTLLMEISEKRLSSEGYKVTNLKDLMPSAKAFIELGENGKEIVQKIVTDIIIKKTGNPEEQITDDCLKDYMHRLGVAQIYRLRKGHKRPKTFAGFSDYVFCSSGIISNFLELCRLAFYLAESSGQDIRKGDPIDIETQNEAVYIVSEANFDWISKNIPASGPTLSNLIYDFSDIIKEKLYKHMSEPEAARIVIKDPEKLTCPIFEDLIQILDDGMKWSVFQDMGASNAYYPKHKTDVRTTDFILNRIYAPHLRISPNMRWRTQLSVNDLSGLTHPTTRRKKRNLIISRINKKFKAKTKNEPLLFETPNS